MGRNRDCTLLVWAGRIDKDSHWINVRSIRRYMSHRSAHVTNDICPCHTGRPMPPPYDICSCHTGRPMTIYDYTFVPHRSAHNHIWPFIRATPVGPQPYITINLCRTGWPMSPDNCHNSGNATMWRRRYMTWYTIWCRKNYNITAAMWQEQNNMTAAVT